MAEFTFHANPAVIGQLATWAWVTDKAQLAGSLHRFMDLDGYDLTELCTDLARFVFLLGEGDGEQLFGTGQP